MWHPSLLILLSILLTPPLPGTSVQDPGEGEPALRDAFHRYVEAVQGGDLKGLFETVTGSEEMFFLTSSGELIRSRSGYRTFHEEWFAETGWEMPVELLDLQVGDERGHTLAVFRYRESAGEGLIRHLDSYFTLLWRLEEGRWKVIGDVCTPIGRYTAAPDGEVLLTRSQQQVLDTILQRRTVRSFRSDPVPPEHVEMVVDAARHAPTAGNQQPWRFLVVRDRERLDELGSRAVRHYLARYAEEVGPGAPPLEEIRERVGRAVESALSAPVYVAVLADTTSPYPRYAVQDATLAAGNLMNAARALGYGTGFFTTYFPDEVMRPLFGIPDHLTMVCLTPIGVPVEWPDTPPKKPLDEQVVRERFPGPG